MHWIEIYPVDCFNNLLDNRGLGQNVKNPQTTTLSQFSQKQISTKISKFCFCEILKNK